MAAIASLLQTCVWAGLIIWLVRIYGDAIRRAVEALIKRIEGGDNFEAAGIKLFAPTSQSTSEQAMRVNQEVLEASTPVAVVDDEEAKCKNATSVGSSLDEQRGESSNPSQLNQEPLPLRFLQAEDLALRSLQAQRGRPIQRQVKLFDCIQCDGLFEDGGVTNIVEVKLVKEMARIRVTLPVWVDRTRRLIESQGSVNMLKFRIIVVLVFPHDIQALEAAKLSASLRNDAIPLEVVTFSERALRAEFGV